MAKPLVIVESPAKAKTIARFLGDGYLVESSIGHIRDLPRSAADVPAAYKGEAWARLGVDVDNDFKPLYVVARERKDQVRRLKSLVNQASEVYLATDEDREGESIAWHLLEVLSPSVPVKRMVFHEITQPAIEAAISHPRDLDRRLVDAQEARRILDRLYGYELSPVLWKKVMQGLSAGRVQSVATRIIVERERERMAFRPGHWWSVTANFATGDDEYFDASLLEAGDRAIAAGSDFSSVGLLLDPAARVLLDESAAEALVRATDSEATVASLEERPYRRSPAAPFITSTLQQEAARKLRFSAQRTMQVAQRLYEQGYITYMRTDSTTLSSTALDAARHTAHTLYGGENVPATARRYERRVKNAQEAHEAIRPAGEQFRSPGEVAAELGRDELRLYELVWQRTVASQMIDATGVTQRVRLSGRTTDVTVVGPGGTALTIATSGTVITTPGFLRVYTEGSDEEDDEQEETRLPRLSVGDRLTLQSLSSEGHATKPPPRYTEASLVKRLEDLGVGRPSTYANILQTIQDRGYVWKRGTALVPSFTAFAVVGLLEEHFPSLVDYSFTATMEDDLDEIAAGAEEAIPYLERFYFGIGGNGSTQAPGLKEAVLENLAAIDAREINSIRIGADSQGEPIVVRVGRYGPYLQRGDDRAPVPEDLAPDELVTARAEELLAAPIGERDLGADPTTGLPVRVRAGRFGPYVELGEREKTSSLFKSMSPETVTLDMALELLRLPRVIGTDPESGAEIVARNGRYGPYLQRGEDSKDSRSLEREEQLLEIGLDEALVLFAQPKRRRFGGPAVSQGRELGTDPESGGTITVRSGRFGPYVTDGTTNASLRRGDDPDTVDLERAAELLAERRAAPPRPGKRAAQKVAAKRPAKKAATKKAPAKRAAKKTTAKKATAKKAPGKRSTSS